MGLRRFRSIAALAVSGLFPAAASAQLASVEADDLRLLYRDPFQTYLAPHVGRCFLNAVDFEKLLFDWRPSGPVTVLLNDFSDAGNASASAVPRNTLCPLPDEPITGFTTHGKPMVATAAR